MQGRLTGRRGAAAGVAEMVILLAGTQLDAATIDVPQDAATVAAGLGRAAAGDTVRLACGTYEEHDLVLPAGVVLRSASGDPDCAVLDARGEGRVLVCLGGDVDTRVEGLTLRGGFTTEHGAGLYGSDTDLVITDCLFAANSAGNWGGAIAFRGASSPQLIRCRFFRNSASYGGGVYCEGGSPIVRDCDFQENSVLHSGGGIACWSASTAPFLEGCTFVTNRAIGWFGAGLFCDYGSAQLARCTFHGNWARQGGGAVSCRNGASVSAQGCILANSSSGDAVHCRSGSQAVLECCDVFGNEGGDWVGCLEGQAQVAGNFRADPLFCAPDAGDLRLAADSPCAPPGITGCGLVGARGVGCDPITRHPESWGKVKALFR